MAPTAKRRKRNVVDTSEDDEDTKPRSNTLSNFLIPSSPNGSPSPAASRPPTASPSPLKLRSTASRDATRHLPTRNRTRNGVVSSPASSPEKTKSRPNKKAKIEEKGKTADLLTLFSNQAQKAHMSSTSSGVNGHRSLPANDIISDPISEDDDFADSKASAASIVGKAAQKRGRDGSVSGSLAAFTTSQKFLKPPKPQRAGALDDDLRPWTERFGPTNLDELAVHKRKVADVRRWLDEVLSARMRQRLLVLKGAAGSGKTTTVRLLARELSCDLLEWRNPTGPSSLGLSSASARFDDFLGVGGKFGVLDIDSGAEAPGDKSKTPAMGHTRKILLVEEFPNTFTRSSSALTSFRNTILQYLSNNTPSLSMFGRHSQKGPIIPVVLVISETLLTTTSASADSLTAHRLLGPEILRHAGTGTIEFNAIAPSLLLKALELVVQKEARKSGRRRTPGPQVLKRLGEIGDIRNAVASLEFLCLKGDQETDWGGNVALTKQKKSKKESIALTRAEEDSLELVSQREASLGIFHAVGKVVYNKREESSSLYNTVENLPDYLSHHARPKKSHVAVDSLIDETGTDTQTFISALFENYALSCESSSATHSSIDYINACLEYLSDSDQLCPSWDIFFGGKGFGSVFAARDSASHVLRQDEMAFHVAVRGLLFSLPSPVARKTSASGRSADTYKMFYPTSLKLWRAKEEVESLVDMWSSKLLRGEDDLPRKDLTEGANAFRRTNRTGVGSWAKDDDARKPSKDKAGSEAVPLLSIGSAGRAEMILDRLPYMAHIGRARKGALQSVRLKDLEKVVSFQGIGPPIDESIDDGDEGVMTGETWATDKPSDESSPRKKKVGIRAKNDGTVSGLQVQKLVLSDDDIEDD